MRSRLKKITLVFLVPAVQWLCAAPAPGAELSCEHVNFAPTTYTKDTISTTQCPGPQEKTSCQQTHAKLISWADAYREAVEKICTEIGASLDERSSENSVTAFEKNASLLQDASSKVEGLVQEVDKLLSSEIPNQLRSNLTSIRNLNRNGPVAERSSAAENDAFQLFQGGNYRNKFSTRLYNGSSYQVPQGSSISGQVKAFHETSIFIRQLILDRKKRADLGAQLKLDSRRSQELARRIRTAEDPDDPPAKDNSILGMDPNTLAALAGPAAGILSQVMQQNKSGVSDMNMNPAANPPPQPAPNPPAAKLGSGSSGEGPKAAPQPIPDGPAKDPPSSQSAGYASGQYSPGEESFSGADSGSITKGTESGGFSAASAGTVGGSGATETSEGGRAPASADAPKTEEEALHAFGGGGSMGGRLSYSDTSTSSDTSYDSGMTDVFKEMETALDGGDSYLFADTNTEIETDRPSPLATDAESLFPRVRACHLRALKRGLVLNGLGENIEEIGKEQ